MPSYYKESFVWCQKVQGLNLSAKPQNPVQKSCPSALLEPTLQRAVWLLAPTQDGMGWARASREHRTYHLTTWKKFAPDGSHSDKSTGITLTGDQFIGEIIDSNKALIPQAVDQFGQLGPLFDKFLLGTSDEAPEPHDYSTSKHARPNAIKMNKLACSTKVPYGILNTANKQWTSSNPHSWYGESYMEADPKTWAQHHLGLSISNAITGHIHRAFTRLHNPSNKSYYPQRRRRQSITAPHANPIDIINTDQPNIDHSHDYASTQETTDSYPASTQTNSQPSSSSQNCSQNSDLSTPCRR
mmetsp:Transcript_4029/g.5672  ORF Transcript_4029/g.5672 Transcript_4029/m.5672 type:complete len:299 (+) Transcript_4029:1574-2470(+)